MKPLVTVCRRCGERHEKYLVAVRRLRSQANRGVYVDETGRQWHGGRCPSCDQEVRHAAAKLRTPTARGLTPDDYPGLSAGRRREWLVCLWIKQHWGYDVEPSKAFTGPDITLPNGETVEVKGVSKDMSISPLSPARQRDTWIALVVNDMDVHVLPMCHVVPTPSTETITGRCVARFIPGRRAADDVARVALKANQQNKCVRCGLVRPWLPPTPGDGTTRRQSGKNRVDETGRVWLHNRCSDCTAYINWVNHLQRQRNASVA